MDAAKQGPSAMIAELARSMMSERRERFLDAACGSDIVLRTEVEARLARTADGEEGKPAAGNIAQEEARNSVPVSFEAIALDALNTAPVATGAMEDTADSAEALPINVFCDQQQLDLLSRLRLVQQVCRVLDQEHRRGLIHGGLTPGLISITPNRSIKLTPREHGGGTAGDHEGLLHTSPEQVLGEPATTASDIYGLGVLLYELLTGRFPYRVSSVRSDDIANAISEQAPERPSLAIARPDPSGMLPETISQARQTSPRELARRLDGDLELIVLHALHKEPERRYASALQLAEDIERYVQGRPVIAHHGGWRYRVGKFFRRHPGLSATTLLLFAPMIVGLPVLTISLVRAGRDRDRAEISYQAARSAMDDIFAQVSERVDQDIPGLHPGRVAILETALHYYENASERPDSNMESQVQSAEAQKRVARINRLIGLPDVAAWQYEKALNRFEEMAARAAGTARFHDDLTEILTALGELLQIMNGRRAEAAQYLERAQLLLNEQLAAQPKSIPSRRALARVVSDTAQLEHAEGHLDQARILWNRAIDILGPLTYERPGNTEDTIGLASAQIGLGRVLAANEATLSQAAKAFVRGVDLRKEVVRKFPERFDQIYRLALEERERASLYQASGELESAFESENQAAQLFEGLDRRFPDTVPFQTGLYLVYDGLGRLRNRQGETAEALKWAEQARAVLERLAIQHAKEPGLQIDLSRAYSFIGRLYQHAGKPTNALRSFQHAMDVLESLPELDPANSYQLGVNLAACVSLIGVDEGGAEEEEEIRLSSADRLRRQVYGIRAVAALKRAVAEGFLKLEALQDDPDLDSLRGRPDFQKLVAELADKGKLKP